MKLMILRPQSLLLVAILVPAALRAASVIQFQTRTLQVSEGSQANIVLTCTPPATNQIRVVVKHVGGTAQCPDDYWMGFAGQCGGFAFEFAPGLLARKPVIQPFGFAQDRELVERLDCFVVPPRRDSSQ